MRLLHTADWHLGHTLHGISRFYEHERFLAWLLETLEHESVDALIVAGDIFDTANPSPAAQAQYYRFLAECRVRKPGLHLVVVGGNHDSPGRLDAPRELLEALDMHVVGGLPHRVSGEIDVDRVVFPLASGDGRPAAWVVALPFLKRRDLGPELATDTADDAPAGPGTDELHEALIVGHRKLYRRLVDEALSRRTQGEPIIATGHCYMVHGVISELSERMIQVGNQHALPAEIFPSELAYVALGHLHRAQKVGAHENIRYSGSPIPLSLTERHYQHQIVLIDFEQDRVREIRPVFVPRFVEILSLPHGGPRSLDEVLEALATLPRAPPQGADPEERPLLEVKVALPKAHARVRYDIEAALEDAWCRLVRVEVSLPGGSDQEGAAHTPVRTLDSIRPDEVFRACHARARDGDVPEDLMHLFLELLEDVEREEEA